MMVNRRTHRPPEEPKVYPGCAAGASPITRPRRSAFQPAELDQPLRQCDGRGGGVVAVVERQLEVVDLRQSLGFAQNAVAGQPAAGRQQCYAEACRGGGGEGGQAGAAVADAPPYCRGCPGPGKAPRDTGRSAGIPPAAPGAFDRRMSQAVQPEHRLRPGRARRLPATLLYQDQIQLVAFIRVAQVGAQAAGDVHPQVCGARG